MRSAQLLRRFRLVVTTAAFSIAASTNAAPVKSVDLPLPERAFRPHTSSAPSPDRPRPMFVPLTSPSEVPAHPAKHLTSRSHSAKAWSVGGSAEERAADFGSRGRFAMQAGQTEAAIAAFEHALKLDPGITDAWGKLAFLYLKQGSSAKAIDAFKKAKQLGDANGGLVTRDASGGLLFP